MTDPTDSREWKVWSLKCKQIKIKINHNCKYVASGNQFNNKNVIQKLHF